MPLSASPASATGYHVTKLNLEETLRPFPLAWLVKNIKDTRDKKYI